ncbi:MAG: helix-turn-helix domain containing protein [Acidobacteria bacterium]|nr:helix-turn-helix domain containing protein [Acidobacteriota bacterium]
MPGLKPEKPKTEALRRQRALNLHPERVTDPLFQQSEFYDPLDLVQVKYEMLRQVHVDKVPINQSAAAFGFSRPTFYQTQFDFERQGLFGLIPRKKGPRRNHKLTPEVLDYVRQEQVQEPSLSAGEMADRVKKRFGTVVHPRSIERALMREKKKRDEQHSSATEG